MTQPFNLIMISAWHEMGGNVTHRFLDSHPQLMVYPFESTMATPLSSNLLAGPQHFVPQRYAYPVFDSKVYPEAAYHAMADHELKPYLRQRGTSKFRDCGLVMDEKARIARFNELFTMPNEEDRTWIPLGRDAGYIEAHFRATFDTWTNFARTGKETHYVGYIPPILMDADRFFTDFPEGQMVHVIRNPFSGYADTLKRPYPFPLERYCQLWNVCSMQARVYETKYRGRFHTIRYEDLVANPQGELNQLYTKLGLEQVRETPVPSFNRVPLPNGQINPWGTIKQATTEANRATAMELSRDQAVAVFNETLPMLKQWGYEDFLIQS